MNKHFQELAAIVGRAMAKRWMRRTFGGGSGGDVTLTKQPPVQQPLPLRHQRRLQQHK